MILRTLLQYLRIPEKQNGKQEGQQHPASMWTSLCQWHHAECPKKAREKDESFDLKLFFALACDLAVCTHHLPAIVWWVSSWLWWWWWVSSCSNGGGFPVACNECGGFLVTCYSGGFPVICYGGGIPVAYGRAVGFQLPVAWVSVLLGPFDLNVFPIAFDLDAFAVA